MVGVAGVVALLNAAQEAAQLALVQAEALDVAGLLEEVEGQQGQGVPGRGLCQAEDVKLPGLLCPLQQPNHTGRQLVPAEGEPV